MPKAYLEPNEIEKMEEAAEYLRDRLLIHLLFHLGCRVSEVLGITVDDIDFGEGTVTIQHLKASVRLTCPHCGGRLAAAHKFCPRCGCNVVKAVAEVKERHRFRTLPVDGETLDMLKEYIDRGGPTLREGVHFLFAINRHRAWQIVRGCAERAGLPRLKNPESGRQYGVSPHRLRDAFAIHAVKRDGTADGIRLLQEHLGHQSITTTMRYRKLSGEEHRRWLDKVFSNTREVSDARVGNSNDK